jgi:hypothetical protein
MGFVFFCLSLLGIVPIALAFWLVSKGTTGAVMVVLAGSMALSYWIALGVIAAALQGIFHVALFRYASMGKVPSDYPEELIARHWQPKT